MKHSLLLLTSCCVFSLLTPAAEASTAERLSGEVRGGVMLINSANNLNPSSSKNQLTSLEDGADTELSTIPLILPEIRYKVGQQQNTELFLSSRPPIEEAGQFTLLAGVGYTGYQFAQLKAGVFITPFEEKWEDPYLLNTDREETDLSRLGGYLSIDNIGGSPLQLQLVYLTEDVDDDLIAERFSSLSRDGDIYGLAASYSFQVTREITLVPKLIILDGDYDGESESFLRYKAQLQMRYRTGRLMIIPSISYSYTEYDEVHPLFNETREEDRFGLRCVAELATPFGLEDFGLQGILGYSNGDANIDFFDTESTFAGAALVYRF